MIILRLAVLLLLFPVAFLLRILGRRQDMVYLPDDHADMARAISEARARLPEFRAVLLARPSGTDRFSLKVRFPVEAGHEHIWVGNVNSGDTGFHGRIDNIPQSIESLKLGDEIAIDETTISDWGYFRDGIAQGFFTTRALLPHTTRKNRIGILSAMGWSDDSSAGHAYFSRMNPGFYQMSFRGLSWREAWRFSSGPLTFVIAVILKLVGFRGARMWLPAIEAESFCAEAALSDASRAALAPMITEATRLGYGPGRFLQIHRERHPTARDGAAYLCLHRDGNRVLHLAYLVTEVMGQAKTVTNITGGIVDLFRDLTYDFSPSKEHLDGDGFALKFRVSENSVSATDAAMVGFLERNGASPRRFSHLEEFKQVADHIDTAMWEARVKRGLFRYVG